MLSVFIMNNCGYNSTGKGFWIVEERMVSRKYK